jgi:hypothetical protein
MPSIAGDKPKIKHDAESIGYTARWMRKKRNRKRRPGDAAGGAFGRCSRQRVEVDASDSVAEKNFES